MVDEICRAPCAVENYRCLFSIYYRYICTTAARSGRRTHKYRYVRLEWTIRFGNIHTSRSNSRPSPHTRTRRNNVPSTLRTSALPAEQNSITREFALGEGQNSGTSRSLLYMTSTMLSAILLNGGLISQSARLLTVLGMCCAACAVGWGAGE